LIEDLVKHLDHNFIIFVKDLSLLKIEQNNVKIVEIPFANRGGICKIIAEQFLLKKYIKQYKIDLLHSTSFVIPLNIKNVPNIVTVHDLFYELFKKTIKPLQRIYYKLLFTTSIKRADCIISNSNNTTNDIINILHIESSKVNTIYLGLKKTFTNFSDNESDRSLFNNLNLPKKYILYVGSLEPRKNLETVVRVYANIRHKCADKLVIVGASKWKTNELNRLITSLGIENDITFTGYIDDTILPYIYKSASLFIFPSLYEGFGFPLLEAMKMKVPIVTSNISSLPEVVGNAGILVDPTNVVEISVKVLQLLNDTVLRQSMIDLASKHCQQFTWEKTANETLKVYENVLMSCKNINKMKVSANDN